MSTEELTTQVLQNLVEGIRNGNPAAGNELLRRCATRLETLARKMLRRQYFPQARPLDDTNDVLQNASLRMLRTLQTISPNDTRHFFNLAGLHIRQVLLDLLRSCKRRQRFRHVSLLPAELAGTIVSDTNLDLWEAFHEAIDQLPVEDREIVTLTFYHGWTQLRIAELLGVTERTVRRGWVRACATLSKALHGRFPDLA